MDSQDILTSLPDELMETILQYLTIEDLCRAALCSRSWREAANRDVLWRPLCREHGWERHGTIHDLCKEAPFMPPQSNTCKEDAGKNNEGVTFPLDAVVTGSNWPGLVDTCEWKEVCMKAWHLHSNWLQRRYHTVSFEFCSAKNDAKYMRERACVQPEPHVRSLAGEGAYLAGSISDTYKCSQLHVWNMSSGERLHVIEVDVSTEREALQMKNGIIAAGCKDGEIRTYSAQTGEQLQVMSGHRLAVSRLFFDGNIIVSIARPEINEVYSDSDIRVWNAADGACRCILQSGSEGTRLVHFDYMDKMVAGAYNNRTIRVWNAEIGSCIHQIIGEAGELISCHLGDGILIGTYDDSTVKMWSLESGEFMKSFEVPFETELKNGYPNVDFWVIDGELLLSIDKVHPGRMALLNLEGRYIGDTEEQALHQHLIYFHTNKLVTVCSTGGQTDLWFADRRVRFDAGEELTPKLFPFDAAYYNRNIAYASAWMSDTKLAYAHYEEDAQRSRVIVRHYW